MADDTTTLFRTYADTNAVHIRDHVMISSTDGFPPLVTGSDWALAVTGSSLFYSGGTNGTNRNAISVVGDISGTTDLYLGSTTHPTSTITAEDTLIIKGTNGNDYLQLKNDFVQIFYDNAEDVGLNADGICLNCSSRNRDVKINSDDSTTLFHTDAEKNIVRLLDYVSINKPIDWGWNDEQKQALVVSGTSVLYSGGTSHNTEAIVAIGNISGTTNLYIDGNITTGVDINVGNDVKFVDNGQAIFGDGGDLSITHNSIKSIITNTTGELLFENEATDADIRFKGDDGGDTITALTLDMSEAGAANFNSTVTASGFVGNVTGNADTVTNGVYTTNNLSVMAATTSTQLAGVISDETGSGSLVFGYNCSSRSRWNWGNIKNWNW